MRAATYKPRLPSYLSYPVGFEHVDEALRAVPQRDALELVFRTNAGLSATAFRKTVESRLPHLVLSACFRKWDKSPSIGDQWVLYLDGVWRLDVYPVHRPLRVVAKRELLARGLPAVEQWLQAKRPPSWYWGEKRCDIIFDPGEEVLRVEEKIVKV